MEKIEEAVLAYVQAIKETEEYKEYVLQKDKVLQYPVLKSQIDEFRSRSYRMQVQGCDQIEEIEAFEREYEKFRENTLVADFLAAELAFCRLMQRLNVSVVAGLDFE
jgi:cell fate (sporulation/competence/biofilm development) regulator YlbF (YheA/YmcA/DUF963 family)